MVSSMHGFVLLITAKVLQIFKKAYYLGQGELLSAVIVNVSTFVMKIFSCFHGLTTHP